MCLNTHMEKSRYVHDCSICCTLNKLHCAKTFSISKFLHLSLRVYYNFKKFIVYLIKKLDKKPTNSNDKILKSSYMGDFE